MITNITNNNPYTKTNFKTQNNHTAFAGTGTIKFLDAFIKSQENLSTTRFIQGTMTNWLPKAVLSRSLVDFSEFTFLELLESGLFYFAAPFLGEHLFKNKIFKAVQPRNSKQTIVKNLTKSVNEIKKSNLDKTIKNRLITTKGGILLACLAVPAMEYSIGFAKNLFTLKVFKVSNFDNIANLDKNKKEDSQHQKKVENHSKNVLIKTGRLIALASLSGILLAKYGYKSKLAVDFSEFFLEPGEAVAKLLEKKGIKSEKTKRFLKEYLKLDFASNNGKFALSKGQLAATCITGLFGYSAASKDRGKLDFYETWTRVPLVVIYTIFGSSLLDAGFKKFLAKKGKCPDLIKLNEKGIIENIPARKDLTLLAEKLSKTNKTSAQNELSKLIKQKAIIIGVPYLFSLIAMGFILSGVSRIWTKYRYNHQTKNHNQQPHDLSLENIRPAFKKFIRN